MTEPDALSLTGRIEALRAEADTLLAKITPGEWYVERKYDGGCTVAIMRDWSKQNVALGVHGPNAWIHQHGIGPHTVEANAEFIAAAPRLVRELLSAILASGTRQGQEREK